MSTPLSGAAPGAAAGAHALPRRYRVTLAAICVLAGVGLGVLIATQPWTPPLGVATVSSCVALGALLGLGAFRALEHSLE